MVRRGVCYQQIWLILVLIQVTFSQEINVTFLTAVLRLESHTLTETTSTNMTRDYYFCCNVVGRFLQWEYNDEPLSGFRMNEFGKVLLDERLDYTYTATLLSSQPEDSNQARMDSVLVMSFPNGTDPGQFTITCISNLNIMSTIAENVSHVKNSDKNGEVQLDYVVSGNIVSNRNRTHIFMCGVQHTPQFIEVTGPILGFTRFDDVGRARTVYLQDQRTADVQGILIARTIYQAVVLIVVASFSDLINVSCYDSFSSIMLQSREKVKPVDILQRETDVIRETTVNSTELLTKDITESVIFDSFDDGITVQIVASSVSSIIFVLLTSVMAVIITAKVVHHRVCFSVPIKNEKDSSSPYVSEACCSIPVMDNFTPIPFLRATSSVPAMHENDTSTHLPAATKPSAPVLFAKSCDGGDDSTFCYCDFLLDANQYHDEAQTHSDGNDGTSDTQDSCDCKPLNRDSNKHNYLEPSVRSTSTPALNEMDTSLRGVCFSAPTKNEKDNCSSYVSEACCSIPVMDNFTPIPLLRATCSTVPAMHETDMSTHLPAATKPSAPVLFAKSCDGGDDSTFCYCDLLLDANQYHDEAQTHSDGNDGTSDIQDSCDYKPLKLWDRGYTSNDEEKVCVEMELEDKSIDENTTPLKTLSKGQLYPQELLFGPSEEETNVDEKTCSSREAEQPMNIEH